MMVGVIGVLLCSMGDAGPPDAGRSIPGMDGEPHE